MHVTQITLTDRERWLLAQLMAVATAFCAKVFGGVEMDAGDADIMFKLKDCADEIEALSIKLNLDRV